MPVQIEVHALRHVSAGITAASACAQHAFDEVCLMLTVLANCKRQTTHWAKTEGVAGTALILAHYLTPP